MPIKKLLNKFTYTPIEKIRGSHLPVLLYGMGNGAEKMYKICVENNIIPDGVFASDGFKSGKTFLGYTVVPASELKDLYPKGFIALVCFGCNSADMRMYIGRVKRLGGLVLMPHLPLFGGEFLTGSISRISFRKSKKPIPFFPTQFQKRFTRLYANITLHGTPTYYLNATQTTVFLITFAKNTRLSVQ